MKVSGGLIKKGVLERFQSEYGDAIAKANLKVEILRFVTPATANERGIAGYQAAEDSRVQKTKTFRALGIEVVEREFLPQDLPQEDFQRLIDNLGADPSVHGIIVQYPIPKQCEIPIKTITPEKDLDSLSSKKGIFKVPATSVGIVRVIEPFLTKDTVVSVVGSNGFVGAGVVSLLNDKGVATIEFDQSQTGFKKSDLENVKKANIVVSVTGQPGILDERHLSPEQILVIDGGYFPVGNEKLGDVARSAVNIPQNYTPVPGGVGPIEMAVLMERVVQQNIDPDVKPWKLEDYLELEKSMGVNISQVFTTNAIGQDGLQSEKAYQPKRGELIRWYGAANVAQDEPAKELILEIGQQLKAEFQATGGGEVAPMSFSSPTVVVDEDFKLRMEAMVEENAVYYEIEITTEYDTAIEPEQTKRVDRGR
jgi:methylenetetrahydrofolate dehydrogenase (NADP+) / methenyltetrahydrofolate cyclohydrolase